MAHSAAFVKQKLCLDFATLKHACPKGIYIAPDPDQPLTWTGVFFARKGPYANAVLRFHIDFSPSYPARPPVITFRSDVFHPLVTPLTTYTHSTRDAATETLSSADEDKLPPGGFALKHGFPEWFPKTPQLSRDRHSSFEEDASPALEISQRQRPPHIVEVLQYLRVIFETEAVLDSIPLGVAANSGAWHAWRSYRTKTLGAAAAIAARHSDEGSDRATESSTTSRQQPGGARRPGEWNWQGVWEDRVRKSIQASNSELMLYGGSGGDAINFVKMEDDAIKRGLPFTKA